MRWPPWPAVTEARLQVTGDDRALGPGLWTDSIPMTPISRLSQIPRTKPAGTNLPAAAAMPRQRTTRRRSGRTRDAPGPQTAARSSKTPAESGKPSYLLHNGLEYLAHRRGVVAALGVGGDGRNPANLGLEMGWEVGVQFGELFRCNG